MIKKSKLSCMVCGKSFLVSPHRLKPRKDGSVVKYCSRECLYASKVGKHVSDNTRIKMSKSHGKPIWLTGMVPWNKGKHGLQIAWNKGKICPQFRGDKHWNWNGGITPEVRRVRNSTEYKIWRLTVFERDGFTCVFCGQKGGVLHADHIKPFCKFKELRLDPKNGRTLCINCHKKTDTYLRKAIAHV